MKRKLMRLQLSEEIARSNYFADQRDKEMLNEQQNDSRSEDQQEDNYFYSDTNSGGELELDNDKIGVSDFQIIEPNKETQ